MMYGTDDWPSLPPFSALKNHILCAEVLAYLRLLPDECVHCVVTSPPYFGLRDYGVDGQIGMEDTPQAFIQRLVEVFREVRRVLRHDGVCWVNMGDCFAANRGYQVPDSKHKDVGNAMPARVPPGFKPKDLMLMPHRLAIALQEDGWWIRMDCVWAKGNVMPESVTDRPVKAHEYVFLLTKSESYWYDHFAVMEKGSANSHGAPKPNPGAKQKALGQSSGKSTLGIKPVRKQDAIGKGTYTGFNARWKANPTGTRNLRSVWQINTSGYKEAHFAVFPPALPERCILAGCPPFVCACCGAPYTRQVVREFVPQADVSAARGVKGANGQKPMDASNGWDGAPRGSTIRKHQGWKPGCDCHAEVEHGVVLDPFMGSGTVAMVARRLKRHFVGCDLNPEYVQLARERLMLPYERRNARAKRLSDVSDLPLFAALAGEES